MGTEDATFELYSLEFLDDEEEDQIENT